MKKHSPLAYELHQKLKLCFGNRKSSSHSRSNLNAELAAIIGTNSGFSTDLGCRYRTTAGNVEALLLHQEAVETVAKLRSSDHVETLDDILSSEDLDETIVQASVPLMLYRLCLDRLHATFSGKNEYGVVRAVLMETKDHLDEAASKV